MDIFFEKTGKNGKVIAVLFGKYPLPFQGDGSIIIMNHNVGLSVLLASLLFSKNGGEKGGDPKKGYINRKGGREKEPLAAPCAGGKPDGERQLRVSAAGIAGWGSELGVERRKIFF